MLLLFIATGLVVGGTFTAYSGTQSSDNGKKNEALLSDIDALKQESLLKGQIFDRYLIPYEKSPASIDYYGGMEQARLAHTQMKELLIDSRGNEYMEMFNGGAMRLSNFHTLLDSTPDYGEVAALVIAGCMQAGTYQPPQAEPLQKLHEYLITEHNAMHGDAGERLAELVGDMEPLTPEVLEILEMYTLFGKPPTELWLSDQNYWGLVTFYGYCILIDKGDDCGVLLEELQERAWDDTPPEGFHHVDPPDGAYWPIPEAYGSHSNPVLENVPRHAS